MNRPDVDADWKAEIKAIYEENGSVVMVTRRIRDELTKSLAKKWTTRRFTHLWKERGGKVGRAYRRNINR